MRSRGISLGIALIALACGEAHGGYYVYTPSPFSPEQVNHKGADEVAVKEVTVVKGDSLYRISRRMSGRGMYYPQILLFNRIPNPNLIYPGQVLRVPLTARTAIRNTPELSVTPTTPPLSTPPAVVAPAPVQEEAPPPAEPVSPPQTSIVEPATPPVSSVAVADTSGEQALFAKGIRAYKADRCRQAIVAFDKFLSRYPDSALAADATLYRADCYLKLGSE